MGEYKEIAVRLKEQGIFDKKEANILRILAGYRNRLVHFYHEVSVEELYMICSSRLGDLEAVQDAYRHWLRDHPGKLDSAL